VEKKQLVNQFFLAFIRGVSSKIYADYVYVPVGEELD
jgi:hypothetical protein